MLGAVKDVLTKEVDVKGILTKEVNVKEFLEMEIELTQLKQLLATEIKLKEFLVQEIDLSKLMSNISENKNDDESSSATVSDNSAGNNAENDELTTDKVEVNTPLKVKRDLPAFDYSLVAMLAEEHKKIRFIYNRLMSYTIEKNYAQVASQLEIFNSEMREHYRKADNQLYDYLRTYVQIKYPKREKAFAQLSLEMKNISIEIFFIISQSPHIPLTEKSYDAFMKEFLGVGKLMNERINREKDLLFKMYEQTNAATSIS